MGRRGDDWMLKRCEYPGCGSYALNEHPESGLCDKCWWRMTAEDYKIEAEMLTKYCNYLKNFIPEGQTYQGELYRDFYHFGMMTPAPPLHHHPSTTDDQETVTSKG